MSEMSVAQRDAILKLSQDPNWHQFLQWLLSTQSLMTRGLTCIDPTQTVEIARVQGRIAAYDEVLHVAKTAEDQLND